MISIEYHDPFSAIVLYGAGAMGEAALAILKEKKANVIYFADKNIEISGTYIEDIQVIHPEAMKKSLVEKSTFLVSMCACPFFEIKEYLTELGAKFIHPAGDYLQTIFPQRVFANVWSFKEENSRQISEAYQGANVFTDLRSAEDYSTAIKWFICRDERLGTEKHKISREKYFPIEVLNMLRPDDVYLDTAAMGGIYIEQIKKKSNNKFKDIYSFLLNMEQIEDKYYEDNRLHFFECEAGERAGKQSLVRMGLMKPFISENEKEIDIARIDDKMERIPYQYLRGYSMSPILPAIQGGIQSIKEYRPILALNIGHYKEDFIYTLNYLKVELKNYNYLFRIHSYQGIDCILYAFPKERCL